MNEAFVFACPSCRTRLKVVDENTKRCPHEGQIYRRVDGIWRFIRPDRETSLTRFISEYEAVRRAEGRGSVEAAYYRELPFKDLTGNRVTEWAIRARSFSTLLDRVIKTWEGSRPMRILDMGAGNGWLSYQLAKRGHHLAAVDLGINEFDGLGAHVTYDHPFLPLQAEFDYLPLAEQQVDLVIFNASLHYSVQYEQTVLEAFRVLGEDGMLAVLDTPHYHEGGSGVQMVRERQAQFLQAYGFPSDAMASENYLTYERLSVLAQTVGLQWSMYWPIPRWRWLVRRWRDRLRGRREPAHFPMLIVRRE